MMEMVTGTVIPVAHASNTITMFIEVVVSLGFLPCSSLLCSCSLLLLVLLQLMTWLLTVYVYLHQQVHLQQVQQLL